MCIVNGQYKKYAERYSTSTSRPGSLLQSVACGAHIAEILAAIMQ